MWVCSEGFWLMDPSVFFLRDLKAHCPRVDAWLAKEKLVVGLSVTPELWRWPAVSRVVCGQLGIHQYTSHCLRFDGTMVNAQGVNFAQLLWLAICRSWEFDADSSRSVGHRGM